MNTPDNTPDLDALTAAYDAAVAHHREAIRAANETRHARNAASDARKEALLALEIGKFLTADADHPFANSLVAFRVNERINTAFRGNVLRAPDLLLLGQRAFGHLLRDNPAGLECDEHVWFLGMRVRVDHLLPADDIEIAWENAGYNQ